MNLVEKFHGRYIHPRRTQVLSEYLSAYLPRDAHVLDVGCGDGLLAYLIGQKRPDLTLVGIDVAVREETYVPVEKFDGGVLPYGDASLDVVMFVDVLHHTEDPLHFLREARRVARKAIVVKDHLLNGLLAKQTLRFMDRLGNVRYGVSLPHHYWPRQRWLDVYRELNLNIAAWTTDVRLYPWPASWLFGRSLHFIARLEWG